jgi:endonuclease III
VEHIIAQCVRIDVFRLSLGALFDFSRNQCHDQGMSVDAQTTKTVLKILAKRYTKTGMTNLGNPNDTLLATLLSARTTDVQVLKLFPAFRKKFPNWKALAAAKVTEIESSINTIGLFRAKARAVKGLAQKILTEFGGKVPRTMEELVTLPGVGRKTASVVLSFCFDTPAIAVDTHVFRVTHRLGWSKGKTPEQVEQELRARVPQKIWSEVNRTIVPFGREICVGGRAPKCWMCPVVKYCPYQPKTPPPASAPKKRAK